MRRPVWPSTLLASPSVCAKTDNAPDSNRAPTALSLTEIAYRLGFASQSHFTAVFGGVAHLRLQNWRVRSTKAFITGSAARSALQARAISHAASGIESSLKRTPGGLHSAAELGASATPMPALTSMSIVKSSFVS